MSPEELQRHTDDAVANSEAGHVPSSVENPDAYLAECRERFQKERIFPVARVITIDARHAGIWGVPPGPREVLFVNRGDGGYSVFWDPVLSEFGAADAPEPDGTFSDLALRSPDPIEMYLA